MPTKTTLPLDTLAVGDCLETMAAWPENSVDLVFADPPYNINYAYKLDAAGRAAAHHNPPDAQGRVKTVYHDNLSDEDYLEWTYDWINAATRLLKPTGSFYILIGDEYAAEVRVHLKSLERTGQLAFRNWIVWHYTFGQNCRSKFNRSHAHLFYCTGSATLKAVRPSAKRSPTPPTDAPPPVRYEQKVKVGKEPFTFNRDAIAVKSARQTTYSDARANPKGKVPDDTWYLRPQEAIENKSQDHNGYFEPDGDCWTMSRLCGTFKERLGWHPCQLPEALLERILKLSSNPSDVVFDPFTGSGTTLAVAARLDRHWLGCELSEDYALKATERIQHVQDTGETLRSTMDSKGIQRGKPRKKAEPKRSPPTTRKRKAPTT